MSKAFTRESDDSPDVPATPLASPLPPGARNYLTVDGAERLRRELNDLVQVQRPRWSAASHDPEAKRQLQKLDQRIRYLQISLDSAEIVAPPAGEKERVRFGATVTVRNARGEEEKYRIVGVDETDLDRGWVSWLSPIARALINKRRGERVRFQFPSGKEDLDIVEVSYESH